MMMQPVRALVLAPRAMSSPLGDVLAINIIARTYSMSAGLVSRCVECVLCVLNSLMRTRPRGISATAEMSNGSFCYPPCFRSVCI
mgnify:CR=1 FL=1